jgi:hypothetical protein
MANPWTKKNPFLSMWLSGANALASRARGQAKAEARKQQAAFTKQATRFWMDAWRSAIKPGRRR